jgi:hypothetical protein
MGCPALGIWVAFLKQPDALPGRAPQKMFYKKFELLFIICDFLLIFFRIFFYSKKIIYINKKN